MARKLSEQLQERLLRVEDNSLFSISTILDPRLKKYGLLLLVLRRSNLRGSRGATFFVVAVTAEIGCLTFLRNWNDLGLFLGLVHLVS